MPWKRAKALGPPLLGMELFAQAERIQREAIAAAGRFIPMVQENVRGAQPFVGRARWHYGSFYLWGDVPALMPIPFKVSKVSMAPWRHPSDPRHVPGQGFNTLADRQTREISEGIKVGGAVGDDWFTHHNRSEFEDRITKNGGDSWFNVGSPGQKVTNQNPVHEGVKQGGDWFNAEALDDGGQQSISRRSGSKSSARKAASARIAKIPFRLAQHIAKVWKSQEKG